MIDPTKSRSAGSPRSLYIPPAVEVGHQQAKALRLFKKDAPNAPTSFVCKSCDIFAQPRLPERHSVSGRSL